MFKKHGNGRQVADIVQKFGVAEQTDAKQINKLEEENPIFMEFLAALSFKNHILNDMTFKNE